MQIIVKMLMLMLVLPALGLISFHGGLFAGLLASVLIAVVGVLMSIPAAVLMSTVGSVSVVLARLIGGAEAAVLMVLFLASLMYGAILWGVSCLMPATLILHGFWPTVLAGALLGLVTTGFALRARARGNR